MTTVFTPLCDFFYDNFPSDNGNFSNQTTVKIPLFDSKIPLSDSKIGVVGRRSFGSERKRIWRRCRIATGVGVERERASGVD